MKASVYSWIVPFTRFTVCILIGSSFFFHQNRVQFFCLKRGKQFLSSKDPKHVFLFAYRVLYIVIIGTINYFFYGFKVENVC